MFHAMYFAIIAAWDDEQLLKHKRGCYKDLVERLSRYYKGEFLTELFLEKVERITHQIFDQIAQKVREESRLVIDEQIM
ncbi:MAG: hypothetical protein R3B41_01035 [Candidatus Doudnabacteria bacterium]